VFHGSNLEKRSSMARAMSSNRGSDPDFSAETVWFTVMRIIGSPPWQDRETVFCCRKHTDGLRNEGQAKASFSSPVSWLENACSSASPEGFNTTRVSGIFDMAKACLGFHGDERHQDHSLVGGGGMSGKVSRAMCSFSPSLKSIRESLMSPRNARNCSLPML
jgi:hypothetical protein